ncbi:monoacylglycerol lipase ABHD12-like [Galendromus occidentalis]|uniref:Monoacylglycerol lipase ABHD12-like n=1 Tax=Galendromus occidentalis TaxID=34638 RepID=A0AAJ6QPH6_9ACAR|nr:monoacylglycerol lipase ABHD12-like [Galendromus occidentalis]
MNSLPGGTFRKSARPTSCLLKTVRFFALLSLTFAVATFLIFPLVFYYSPSVRRAAIFRNNVHDQRIAYQDSPADHGMNCTELLYFKMSDGNEIGVWEMATYETGCVMYKSTKPLIYFLHGNSGSRSTTARKEKYRFFMRMGFDVVTLDYRGFGDSGGFPTAEHVVEDVTRVYNHIREKKLPHEIIVWGHSLGTGIASKFVAKLTKNETVGALVLETPFDKVGNVLFHHSLTVFVRHLPCFEKVFVDRLNENPETAFNSVDYVRDMDNSMPVLILATEDDQVVPAVLAKALYDGFVRHRGDSNVFLKTFDAKHGFGHMNIHHSKDLPNIIDQFVGLCCKAP